jgi:tetratricopeptide (TPR) repeat protein
VLLLGPALGLVAAGCASFPESAARQMQDAHRAYLDRKYAASEQLLTPVIEGHAKHPEAAEALYVRGLCYLQTNRRTQARADFERALATSQRPVLTALLRAQLGNLEFDDGHYARASELYAEAERDLPEGPPTDRIVYQQGVGLQRAGRFADARVVLAKMFIDYPGSPYAADARRKYKWKYDYFTVQCGAFTQIATAHEIAARLRQKGFDALAVPDDRSGSKLHYVHAGKHPDFASAAAAAETIRSVIPDAFVVP